MKPNCKHVPADGMCAKQLQKAIIQLTREATGTVVTSIKNDFRNRQQNTESRSSGYDYLVEMAGQLISQFSEILFLFCPLL